MFYVGILSNRGKILESDEDAIRYALTMFDLYPANDFWQGFDYEGFAEFFDLESYFSGDWIIYKSREEYEAEQERLREQENDDDSYIKEKRYWDALQYRTGSRL